MEKEYVESYGVRLAFHRLIKIPERLRVTRICARIGISRLFEESTGYIQDVGDLAWDLLQYGTHFRRATRVVSRDRIGIDTSKILVFFR